jgi:hypothetical protein
MGLSGLISLGPPENVAGRITDQQEQDSNLGGWRKRRFIHASWPAPGSLQNSTGPLAQGCWVFMPQNAEASKWEGQKQTWWLAFRYYSSISVVEGHLLFLSERSETGPTWGKGLLPAFRAFPWVSLSTPCHSWTADHKNRHHGHPISILFHFHCVAL